MLTYTYDITLVAAALCVSMIAAFTGLTLTKGLSAFSHGQRKMFVSMAALALGGGIWSTHFVAMLALNLPVDISYDPLLTLASVMFAVLLVGIALLLMHFSDRNRLTIVLAGTLIGAGIVSMHFVGMSGIRGCIPMFDAPGKIISAIVAVAMGIAAVQISYGRRTDQTILYGTLVFGFSVVFSHFTAMYWTGFARLPDGVVIAPSIQNSQLAMIVTLAVFVICGAFLLSASTFILKPPPTVELSSELVVAGLVPPTGPAEYNSSRDHSPEGTGISETRPVFVASPNADLGATQPIQAKLVPYESDGKVYFLKPEDISAARADGHYTLLYAGGEELFCPWSIRSARSQLSEDQFFQTHRSYLVNIQKVSAFERKKDNGICVLHGEAIESVPVSRSKINALKIRLGL
ncbi:MAG: MHYT domain-containing protein [Rhizobiaceae bacterium]